MIYYQLGEVIRELRSRQNMTQESLAEGICSVGSIAKIEGGTQMPSGHVAEALLARLGERSSFFIGFGKEQQLLELRNYEQLLAKAMEKGDKPGSAFERQLYAYVKLIDRQKHGEEHQTVLMELMEILAMSMPIEELYEQKRNRYAYTYLELFILNNIAVQFYYLECIESSCRILERLSAYLWGKYIDEEIKTHLLPMLHNNLATVKLRQQMYTPAKQFCLDGIRYSINAGMLTPLPYLFENLSNTLFLLAEVSEAQRTHEVSDVLMRLQKERTGRPLNEELAAGGYLISFPW
ncbi:MAG: helix-turn-helix transcriptional regulator [bacterium]|nr:helix-turn-helix transcriptional regulator [bacterium]